MDIAEYEDLTEDVLTFGVNFLRFFEGVRTIHTQNKALLAAQAAPAPAPELAPAAAQTEPEPQAKAEEPAPAPEPHAAPAEPAVEDPALEIQTGPGLHTLFNG